MKIGLGLILIAGALAGCASLQPRPELATANENASCKGKAPPTGSHLVDVKTCGTSGDAIGMSGDSVATAMRQANPGGIRGQ